MDKRKDARKEGRRHSSSSHGCGWNWPINLQHKRQFFPKKCAACISPCEHFAKYGLAPLPWILGGLHTTINYKSIAMSHWAARCHEILVLSIWLVARKRFSLTLEVLPKCLMPRLYLKLYKTERINAQNQFPKIRLVSNPLIALLNTVISHKLFHTNFERKRKFSLAALSVSTSVSFLSWKMST